MLELAQLIVIDGEGASKFITIKLVFISTSININLAIDTMIWCTSDEK